MNKEEHSPTGEHFYFTVQTELSVLINNHKRSLKKLWKTYLKKTKH